MTSSATQVPPVARCAARVGASGSGRARAATARRRSRSTACDQSIPASAWRTTSPLVLAELGREHVVVELVGLGPARARPARRSRRERPAVGARGVGRRSAAAGRWPLPPGRDVEHVVRRPPWCRRRSGSPRRSRRATTYRSIPSLTYGEAFARAEQPLGVGLVLGEQQPGRAAAAPAPAAELARARRRPPTTPAAPGTARSARPARRVAVPATRCCGTTASAAGAGRGLGTPVVHGDPHQRRPRAWPWRTRRRRRSTGRRRRPRCRAARTRTPCGRGPGWSRPGRRTGTPRSGYL